MNVKVSESSDAVLDWMVAKCEGYDMSKAIYFNDRPGVYGLEKDKMLRYSTDWSQGGPIIQSEKIKSHYAGPLLEWECWCGDIGYGTGSTPLIAAMRCYVTSKLGNEVEVPAELL